MSRVIWWLRRDLRLMDNQTLAAAQAAADEVIPLFISDPIIQQSPNVGEKRLAFLWDALRSLDDSLKKRGSRLVFRSGDPLRVLPELLAEFGAEAVFAEEDFSNYARQRDAAISAKVPLHLQAGVTVHHPASVAKPDGDPYIVFTPFRKVWETRPLPQLHDILPAPTQITTPSDLMTEAIPANPVLPEAAPFPATEAEAQRRLQFFSENLIAAYGDERNNLAEDGTSRLSPYLRFGLVSARQAVATAVAAQASAKTEQARKGARTWLSELVWREFFIAILYHFPHAQRGNFRTEYDHINWINDDADFAAWCAGKTGYPVVDAAMRQLTQSGWMHNRARMITASFLVKDLLIDWRWGERFFMQHLIDGDPAANNGGWQWTAGTGTDAAPYFRIFNPTTQGERFDGDGRYIRRWLPELANVPDAYIHQPAKMPPMEQQRSGCIIGKDYPYPIVDHKLARQRTLDAYKFARETAVAA